MEIHAAKCKVNNFAVAHTEILSSLNSKFAKSFEGLYLEWVYVKRASFSQYVF